MRLIILSRPVGRAGCRHGLNLGADDYIAQAVLAARGGRARLRRSARSHPLERQQPALACDELVLDAATNRVTARGKPLNLRGVEYRLLEFLMSHPGRTFNRTQLLAQVWGGDCDVDERTVDVNVQRLRKILSEPGYEAYIQTVRGFGYRFARPAQSVTLITFRVPRDVPRVSAFLVNKSSSPSHPFVTSNCESGPPKSYELRRTTSWWSAMRPSPLKLRSVFISDIHLGFKGCSAELLLDFLHHVEMDTLFLVGRHHRCLEHEKKHVLAAGAQQRGAHHPRQGQARHQGDLRSGKSRRGVPGVRRRGVRQSGDSPGIRPCGRRRAAHADPARR